MQSPSISEIESGLFLGNARSSYDVPTLRNSRITAIVSLVNARLLHWTRPTNRGLISQDRHLRIECVDSSTQDLLQHVGSICNFIDQMFLSAKLLPPSTLSQQSPGNAGTGHTVGGVLVHYDQGVSCSATVVLAYLMRKHHATLPDTLTMVQQKRKFKPNPNFMDQLEVWEQVEYQT
jgi:hypothetical protein